MVMCLWPGMAIKLATYDIYGRVFLPNGTALGVSLALIKSQPMISTIRQLQV